MMALDTNVLVRFLVRDDPKQARVVYERIKRAEREQAVFFIPMVVVLELIWVLESVYGKSSTDILAALTEMRRMPVFQFEKDNVIEGMIQQSPAKKAALADRLIGLSAITMGCESVLTFDRAASRLPQFTHIST